MTRRSPFPRPAVDARRGGFTLIELLTVIAIILVLAGLLINVASNANYKSSFARGQSEIKAMETAMESYKADNGIYPRSTDTDNLNAQPVAGSSPADSTTYFAANKTLFQALSGVPATGTTYGKRYMEFKLSQLNQSNGTTLSSTTTPDSNTVIIDPFGAAYGYSTRGAYGVEQKQTNTGLDISGYGYNPTFDLWSTGGYGSGGKQYSKSGLPTASYNTLWARNW